MHDENFIEQIKECDIVLLSETHVVKLFPKTAHTNSNSIDRQQMPSTHCK